MTQQEWAGQLYEECSRLLQNKPSKVAARTRGGLFAQESLFDWYVLLTGVFHVGCGVLAHEIWERLRRSTGHLMQNLAEPKGKSETDAVSKPEEEARKTTADLVGQAKKDLDEGALLLRQLRENLETARIEPARLAAKEAMKKILTGAGWPGPEADEKSQQIASMLVRRLVLPGGVET
jgi:hypothetical protein